MVKLPILIPIFLPLSYVKQIIDYLYMNISLNFYLIIEFIILWLLFFHKPNLPNTLIKQFFMQVADILCVNIKSFSCHSVRETLLEDFIKLQLDILQKMIFKFNLITKINTGVYCFLKAGTSSTYWHHDTKLIVTLMIIMIMYYTLHYIFSILSL